MQLAPLYLSSVHSEQMAFAACGSDTGAATHRANIRENKRWTPLPFVVISVVGSTPTQNIQHKTDAQQQSSSTQPTRNSLQLCNLLIVSSTTN